MRFSVLKTIVYVQFSNDKTSYAFINKQLKQLAIKEKILSLEKQFQKEICSKIPNAFWDRKQYIVRLPDLMKK